MSMHTTQEWHSSTQMNMTQASWSQKKATKQFGDSRRAHEETVSDNLGMYNELHGSIEQKVKTSYRLIEKLQKRAESVEGSVQLSKQSLAQLEAAYQAKVAPLQLCMWRMEQREKRPLREQVRDAVETSLEEEKQVLVDTQRRLQDAIKKTRAMITTLDGKLDEVRYDLEQKQQALSVDEMCLRTTHRSWHTVVDKAERSAPSRLPGASPHGGRTQSASRSRTMQHQAAYHESSKNEVSRQQEADRLNHSAASREEVAKELRDESTKLISRCDRAAHEAVSRSERMMQERINENQQMRRRLAHEIQEVQHKIEHTKHTISETRTQIKALEEPIELCGTCSSWRKQRATREHIVDPVSTKLSEHQSMLLSAHEELRGHHQSEKSILNDLQERRERLKEDLRDKTAALHIDLNCLTHEAMVLNGKAAKSLSRNKLSRALKVDPSFVPMPHVGHSGGMPLTAR
eukprot:TRINITY_DN81190_c0_g1_i1.p1 TRINITY_DN81190_c0_g1~~TRINITY_DN81190_c0_g1_i1.p1  ORF type:complete len:460 (+),score=126.11 TRINITY_DN81190_c0_g1_i1:105-1484(+)